MRTTLHYIVDGMAGPLVEQQGQLMKCVKATAEACSRHLQRPPDRPRSGQSASRQETDER